MLIIKNKDFEKSLIN